MNIGNSENREQRTENREQKTENGFDCAVSSVYRSGPADESSASDLHLPIRFASRRSHGSLLSNEIHQFFIGDGVRCGFAPEQSLELARLTEGRHVEVKDR
jgi:hypothetical protein